MCDTAIRRIVSLSGLRASVEQVGTMSHSSLMYVVILLRRRRSISQCDSLEEHNAAQNAAKLRTRDAGKHHVPYIENKARLSMTINNNIQYSSKPAQCYFGVYVQLGHGYIK